MDYESDNVILDEFAKEEIVEKRLFPYIPFYIARYEKELARENSVGKDVESTVEKAVKDLEYFRNELLHLHEAGELSDDKIVDLMGFVNTIIIHITDGNKNEEGLVNVMGGTVLETESEKLLRRGREEIIDTTIKRMLWKGKTTEEISDLCGYDLSYVKKIEESMLPKI